ncbi:hypothetical protein CXG81DRAFT_18913 [Caulochytrium protostelioides]|uniref:Uncharacterized protein n=1 Tax=Caulochytrium protostelioides TaxID=1555241 RepID=A0A4P9X7Q8_9FUNG|nr:hypothetical protein CXG81DRAFT_18913 [Caulochytrium protostelioides]|eukprot:RKP01287.1 hypothetical protein CXG81DRAFT_18913 [Caulochytrium protostelioides]
MLSQWYLMAGGIAAAAVAGTVTLLRSKAAPAPKGAQGKVSQARLAEMKALFADDGATPSSKRASATAASGKKAGKATSSQTSQGATAESTQPRTSVGRANKKAGKKAGKAGKKAGSKTSTPPPEALKYDTDSDDEYVAHDPMPGDPTFGLASNTRMIQMIAKDDTKTKAKFASASSLRGDGVGNASVSSMDSLGSGARSEKAPVTTRTAQKNSAKAEKARLIKQIEREQQAERFAAHQQTRAAVTAEEAAQRQRALRAKAMSATAAAELGLDSDDASAAGTAASTPASASAGAVRAPRANQGPSELDAVPHLTWMPKRDEKRLWQSKGGSVWDA